MENNKKDKKAYIMDMADLSRKDELSPCERIQRVEPKRRAIMTSDDDEEFIRQYYSGRTDAFRSMLREDKRIKNWRK